MFKLDCNTYIISYPVFVIALKNKISQLCEIRCQISIYYEIINCIIFVQHKAHLAS